MAEVTPPQLLLWPCGWKMSCLLDSRHSECWLFEGLSVWCGGYTRGSYLFGIPLPFILADWQRWRGGGRSRWWRSASCRMTQLPANCEEGRKKVGRETYYSITHGLMVYTDGKWRYNVRTVGMQIEWSMRRRYGAITFLPYCVVPHATMCLTKCGCAGRRTSIKLSGMLSCFCSTAAFQAEYCLLYPEYYAITTTMCSSAIASSVSPSGLPTANVR